MIRLALRSRVLALGIGVTFALAGCTIGGPNRPATATSAAGQPPGSAAVSAAVRHFFVNVIGPGDWTRMAQDSTGNLAVLAGWLQHQEIVESESSRGAIVIQQARVTSMSATEATVALVASRTSAGFRFDYTGPVTLNKTAGGWKVSDYFMNGQSVAESVFPNVSGGATTSGITIKPVGVQLLPGVVNVWAEIVNKTPSQLSWDQPIVVIDEQGQQRGHGALYVSSLDDSSPFVMTGNVTAFGDFAVGNVTLPVSTKTLTLVAGATPQGSNQPVDLRVPIRL